MVSGDEQLAKPDPAIYALAAARFGLPASAMLFVDDSLANIVSARACAAGMAITSSMRLGCGLI